MTAVFLGQMNILKASKMRMAKSGASDKRAQLLARKRALRAGVSVPVSTSNIIKKNVLRRAELVARKRAFRPKVTRTRGARSEMVAARGITRKGIPQRRGPFTMKTRSGIPRRGGPVSMKLRKTIKPSGAPTSFLARMQKRSGGILKRRGGFMSRIKKTIASRAANVKAPAEAIYQEYQTSTSGDTQLAERKQALKRMKRQRIQTSQEDMRRLRLKKRTARERKQFQYEEEETGGGGAGLLFMALPAAAMLFMG